MSREDNRFLRKQAVKLARRHHAAAEGKCADGHAQQGGHKLKSADIPAIAKRQDGRAR